MKRAAFLAMPFGAAVCAVFVGLLAVGTIGGSAGFDSPEKQAVETADAQKEATYAAVPPATKAPQVGQFSTPTSCPIDSSTMKTQVTGLIHEPPPFYASVFDQVTLVQEATAVGNDGRPYSLWLGTLKSDPSQWVLIRWKGAKDPCAEGRDDWPPEIIPLPFKGPSVTLTTIDSSGLSFAASDGTTGRFDYMSKALSTSAAP